MRVDAKSALHLAAGLLDLRDNLFWNFATNGTPVALAETAEAAPLFTETERNNVQADPQLRGISRAADGGLDPRPAAGSPALSTARTTPTDGFYTAAAYKGAFDGQNLWLRGWTFLDQIGMLSTLDPVTAPVLFAAIEGNMLKVSFDSIVGRTYELELTGDFGTWTAGPTVVAAEAISTVQVPIDQAVKFIRVRLR